MPVGRVHELEPCDDEHDEHAGLHNDDEAVEARRLADPDYEDRGDGEDDAHRRHVYQRTGRLPPRARAPYHGLLDLGGGAEQEGWADEGRREVNAEHVEQADEGGRPADADGRRAHGVLEDQVPSDDPRDELAERGVRIGVCAARNGDGARHLGVAQAREAACDRGEDHRDRHGGAGVQCRRDPRENEDARTDDRAHTQRREAHRPEGAPQRALGFGRGFFAKRGDRLGVEQAHPLNVSATPSPGERIGMGGTSTGTSGT